MANGSSTVPDHMVETRQGQGSFALVLLANNEDTSCIHIMQCLQATRTGILTKVPAIVSGPSRLLGVLPPALNLIQANWLLSVPWLGE